MSMEQSPAYVLHVRPFRENSRLVDFLTPDSGRVRAVARVSRRRGGGSLPALFSPLLVHLVGRGELKTLRSWEPDGAPILLQGQWLFSALYLNEILYRLLHEHDAHPRLYQNYREAIAHLAEKDDIESVLRRFELSLLEELGYGIDFRCEADSGEELDVRQQYVLDPERGLIRADPTREQRVSPGQSVYDGAALLAIGEGRFEEEATRRAAKRLLREALGVHLGPRPLQSRALFSQ